MPEPKLYILHEVKIFSGKSDKRGKNLLVQLMISRGGSVTLSPRYLPSTENRPPPPPIVLS